MTEEYAAALLESLGVIVSDGITSLEVIEAVLVAEVVENE